MSLMSGKSCVVITIIQINLQEANYSTISFWLLCPMHTFIQKLVQPIDVAAHEWSLQFLWWYPASGSKNAIKWTHKRDTDASNTYFRRLVMDTNKMRQSPQLSWGVTRIYEHKLRQLTLKQTRAVLQNHFLPVYEKQRSCLSFRQNSTYDALIHISY